jgi:hypothetical protein
LETILFLPGSLDGQRLRRDDALDPAAARLAPLRSRQQRGEGKLKTIFFLLFFAFMIFIGFRTVPAYVAEYQLADKMQESARFAVVTRQNEDQIRESIYKVVQDLEIPAKKEDIKITSTNSLVTIAIDYNVPVDLLVYQTEMHFSPSSANKSLF